MKDVSREVRQRACVPDLVERNALLGLRALLEVLSDPMDRGEPTRERIADELVENAGQVVYRLGPPHIPHRVDPRCCTRTEPRVLDVVCRTSRLSKSGRQRSGIARPDDLIRFGEGQARRSLVASESDRKRSGLVQERFREWLVFEGDRRAFGQARKTPAVVTPRVR